MNEIIEKENIEDLIYEIRGKQVMLDRDLAFLYDTETRTLIQKVKRNIERFPSKFCFQMTYDEFLNWKSQIVMSKSDLRGLRRAPYVFTEQGVAMLSAIIKSNIAIETSIKIMDAFVKMRHYIGNNEYRLVNIETKIIEHDNNIKLLQESFNKFEEKRKINEIYFNGQIYDAYSKILDIVKEARKEIIIIDNYADKTTLDIICKLKVDVLIITKRNNTLTKLDIDKYNKQYHNLKIIYNSTFHDRYIIIDKRKVYHLGSSINYAGSKTFSINTLEDKIIIESLLNKII